MSKGFIKCDPLRSCYFHPGLKLFLIFFVDGFKLSGPADQLEEGWRRLKEPSPGCPKGIETDPPTDVGRYLGCEQHVYTKTIEWQGELPTTLDPPPPKSKKDNLRQYVRTDSGAKAFLTTRSGGPRWSCVKHRTTTDITTGKIIEDCPVAGMTEKALHRVLPEGPRDIQTVLYHDDPDVENSGGAEAEAGGVQAAQPTEQYQPRPSKEVRVIEYDMTQFFESCVQLYAELTDTDPSTYSAAGTPFGPELTDLEDGQGGSPRRDHRTS